MCSEVPERSCHLNSMVTLNSVGQYSFENGLCTPCPHRDPNSNAILLLPLLHSD